MEIKGINNGMDYGINRMSIQPGFQLAGVELSDVNEIKVSPEYTIKISKEARQMQGFGKKVLSSEMGKRIIGRALYEDYLWGEEQKRRMWEDFGVHVEESSGEKYDETRHNFVDRMYQDLFEMHHAGMAYYTKNGTFEGVTNEELSKNTTAIEYKDLEILVSVEEEINKLSKDAFATEAEYYDAVLEKIYGSNLSDKAKDSIGGYVEKLKEKSLEDANLKPKHRMSEEEVEKRLAQIKEGIEQRKKMLDWKETLKLNRDLTRFYMHLT